jgi:hypothetical protein
VFTIGLAGDLVTAVEASLSGSGRHVMSFGSTRLYRRVPGDNVGSGARVRNVYRDGGRDNSYRIRDGLDFRRCNAIGDATLRARPG